MVREDALRIVQAGDVQVQPVSTFNPRLAQAIYNVSDFLFRITASYPVGPRLDALLAQAKSCHSVLQFLTSPDQRFARFAAVLHWNVVVWNALDVDEDFYSPILGQWFIPGKANPAIFPSHCWPI